MKNINYDLVKLLHTTLDTIWRLENYYVKDAEEAKCHSVSALKQILEDEKKHAEMLREEIKMRIEAGVFD
jgi:rubrerythrin